MPINNKRVNNKSLTPVKTGVAISAILAVAAATMLADSKALLALCMLGKGKSGIGFSFYCHSL
jgi:hypothetical protein